MTQLTLPRRADRPWKVAGLAVASWLPGALYAVVESKTIPGELAAIWMLLVALTALPLSITKKVAFHRTCLTVGWLFFGAEILFSVPWLLIPLPIVVAYAPAGPILLLAARRTGGSARSAIAIILAALPFLGLTISLACHG